MFRILALYISFDAEFNADSEYVHDSEVYYISKGLLGQKPCFGTVFWVLKVLWANQAGDGENDSSFRISVKN